MDVLDEPSRHILCRYYGNGQSVQQISMELQIPALKIRAVIGEAKQLTAAALNRRVPPRPLRELAS